MTILLKGAPFAELVLLRETLEEKQILGNLPATLMSIRALNCKINFWEVQ